MIKFGEFEISFHDFGSFRLDGGAMYGSVPKNIWEKRAKADNENCIQLATRSMLIKYKNRVILIDVGLGDKWNDKSRKIFAIQNKPISDLGFDQNSVTDIILTHLHFDHAGGISRFKAGTNEIELVYPQAQIYLQKDNFENALHPNVREKASYLPENVEVLKKAKLNLVSGNVEIVPGISVHQVNGHTVGQQWIEIKSGSESIMYPTDLIPTSGHLPIPFNMGYDICTSTILKEKEEFLSYAMKRNALVVFQHDPIVESCRVTKDDKGHYCPKA